MKSIRSKLDAKKIVNELLKNPELDIILWDSVRSNRIISLEVDEEFDFCCNVTYIDTVNGTASHKNVHISEIVEAIWYNRKDVNRLNDLSAF